MAPLSQRPEVQIVLRRHAAKLRSFFNKYKVADGVREVDEDEEDGNEGTGHGQRISLKELFLFMSDCGQMDHRFGMAKLAAAFIAANNCASAVSENGSWDEWNWELDYTSFLEVLVRIAEIKSKTQEGDLAAKVDRFLVIVAAPRDPRRM